MLRLLIIGYKSKAVEELHSELVRSGFECSILSNGNGLIEQVAARSPDLILVETNGHFANSRIQELVQSVNHEKRVPIMALVPGEMLDSIDGQLNVVDDFFDLIQNLHQHNVLMLLVEIVAGFCLGDLVHQFNFGNQAVRGLHYAV